MSIRLELEKSRINSSNQACIDPVRHRPGMSTCSREGSAIHVPCMSASAWNTSSKQRSGMSRDHPETCSVVMILLLLHLVYFR